jgi:hypothetical protein
MKSISNFEANKVSTNYLSLLTGGASEEVKKKTTLVQTSDWLETNAGPNSHGGCPDETRKTITHYSDGEVCSTSEWNTCCGV